ncbi:MAG: hypothetical protein ACKVS7_12720 [Gemmatimonadaceae bacterium]
MTYAVEAPEPDRLSFEHWQTVLHAGAHAVAAMGLPEPVVNYLRASLLHGDAAQWQGFGNGWSLRSGDDWRKRAKEFEPPETMVMLESTERLRRVQWVEKLRKMAVADAS